MCIDWYTNCQMSNESFLPCWLQFFVKDYSILVYSIGILMLLALAYGVIHIVLRKKIRNNS